MRPDHLSTNAVVLSIQSNKMNERRKCNESDINPLFVLVVNLLTTASEKRFTSVQRLLYVLYLAGGRDKTRLSSLISRLMVGGTLNIEPAHREYLPVKRL